jgi:elongation factor G
MPREYSLEDTRNIGIITHIDAGKTTPHQSLRSVAGQAKLSLIK